jgi:hypothetical protein
VFLGGYVHSRCMHGMCGGDLQDGRGCSTLHGLPSGHIIYSDRRPGLELLRNLRPRALRIRRSIAVSKLSSWDVCSAFGERCVRELRPWAVLVGRSSFLLYNMSCGDYNARNWRDLVHQLRPWDLFFVSWSDGMRLLRHWFLFSGGLDFVGIVQPVRKCPGTSPGSFRRRLEWQRSARRRLYLHGPFQFGNYRGREYSLPSSGHVHAVRMWRDLPERSHVQRGRREPRLQLVY